MNKYYVLPTFVRWADRVTIWADGFHTDGDGGIVFVERIGKKGKKEVIAWFSKGQLDAVLPADKVEVTGVQRAEGERVGASVTDSAGGDP